MGLELIIVAFQVFFSKREFVIVTGLKCYPSLEPVPEYIVKNEPQRRKKGVKEKLRQQSLSTKERDLMSLVGTSFKIFD